MKISVKRSIQRSEDFKPEAIVEHILKDRDIEDVKTFLNPLHPSKISLTDFFIGQKTRKIDKTEKTLQSFQKDWEKTITLFETIKMEKGAIVVYTDYDADGVTGGAILWETLHQLGFNVMPYIPHRKTEGYGFSTKGLDHVKREFDPALIISVDHGIVAHKEISYAKKLGIPVIVTDHHQKQETEPEDAFAVFHIDKLSGSGVSYFFSKEIAGHFTSLNKSNQGSKIRLMDLFKADYLALASIGTVADLVPLTNASRSVVAHGLKAFAHLSRPGVAHLIKEAGLDKKPISTYEIGFVIAPRINAFGRLGHALDALRLLCTTSTTRARELAQNAGKINKDRQDMVKISVEEAENMMESLTKSEKSNPLIILQTNEWEEGVIGLIAGQMLQKYYRPVIAMTITNGFAKASVRSVSGVDITQFLRDLKKYLVDVGGHAAAAGFTIETKNIEKFKKAAYAKAKKEISTDMLKKTIKVDVDIPLKYATLKLAKLLTQLEPFGIGNPSPVFMTRGTIQDIIFMGKNKMHLKILLRDEENRFLQFVYFNSSEITKNLQKDQEVKIVYSLKIDTWNGKEEMKGFVKWLETVS